MSNAVGVTLEASDPDGDVLTYGVIVGPANGVLSGTASALTYTPYSAFEGLDSFDFEVNDGNGGTDTATVSITVSSPETGLVAHRPMNEGTGTTTADVTGNGNTGTFVNGTTWTMGQSSPAPNFDGVDDHVDVGALDLAGMH